LVDIEISNFKRLISTHQCHTDSIRVSAVAAHANLATFSESVLDNRRIRALAANYRQCPAKLYGDRVQQMAHGGTCLLSGIQKGDEAPAALVGLLYGAH